MRLDRGVVVVVGDETTLPDEDLTIFSQKVRASDSKSRLVAIYVGKRHRVSLGPIDSARSF